jgi:hypothetical protein
MALFNYASKEITLKVVFYGPGLCGKTTNLQKLHETMDMSKKGKLLSLSTDADRTLFFDFMPVQLGKIKDFNIRFQLYTVPGQVRYNATRKLVLKGADAVVFVADSQKAMIDQNIESLQNMRENLLANNINPDEVPVVLQYNKRDLKSIMSVAEMNAALNPKGDEIIEASAYEGWGVDETFKHVTKRLLQYISKKHNIQIVEPEGTGAPAATAAPKPAPKPTTPGVVNTGHVKLSVKDKANELLGQNGVDDLLGGGQPAASKDISVDDVMDWGDTPAGGADVVDAEESSGWESSSPAEMDIDSSVEAEAEVEVDEAVGSSELPPPPAMDDMDDDIFDDAAGLATDDSVPAGGSLLEQMLGEDETEDVDIGGIEALSAPEEDMTDSGQMAELLTMILDELKASRQVQQQMVMLMKSMDQSLKVLPALAGKKPAPPKR